MTEPGFLLGGLLVLAALSGLAWRLRALDEGGTIAGFGVGYMAWLGGGLRWLALLAIVLILAVQTTRLGYAAKAATGSAQPGYGIRGWKNVLANVGLAGLAGLGEFAYRDERLAFFFAGALAAALSDTMSTEVGALSSTPPRRLTRPGQILSPGTSGGITPLGLLAGLVGSLIVSLASLILGVIRPQPWVLLAILLAGFQGNLLDSLLGDTLQAKYECSLCGGRIETGWHCGVQARCVGGVSWLGNNAVNAVMTGSAGLAAAILASLA